MGVREPLVRLKCCPHIYYITHNSLETHAPVLVFAFCSHPLPTLSPSRFDAGIHVQVTMRKALTCHVTIGSRSRMQGAQSSAISDEHLTEFRAVLEKFMPGR